MLKPVNRWIPVGLIWLFHLSAIIGILIGYEDWFIPKTPLNLCVIFASIVGFYPLDTPKKWGMFALIALLGQSAEWIGVSQGIPFGDYAYGSNFGPKIAGVPLLIGIFWALLTFVTHTIALQWQRAKALAPLIGALLMLLLDLLMERSAPRFDFWSFGGEPPLENYVSWFGLALIFQGLLWSQRIRGDFRVSLHVFLAQGVFFSVFALA